MNGKDIAKSTVISLMGPPGSGKGTLSLFFVQKTGWKHLSPGNLCRKYSTQDTDIGKSIDFALKSGKMVSNSIITAMIKDWLTAHRTAGSVFICDGYPRTREQAESFCNLLQDFEEFNDSFYVFRFIIPKDIIIKRLQSRLICSNKECQTVYSSTKDSRESSSDGVHCTLCHSLLERRCDDSDMIVINERLDAYSYHEAELLSFYKARGIPVYDLDANQAILHNCSRVKDIVEVVSV